MTVFDRLFHSFSNVTHSYFEIDAKNDNFQPKAGNQSNYTIVSKNYVQRKDLKITFKQTEKHLVYRKKMDLTSLELMSMALKLFTLPSRPPCLGIIQHAERGITYIQKNLQMKRFSRKKIALISCRARVHG